MSYITLFFTFKNSFRFLIVFLSVCLFVTLLPTWAVSMAMFKTLSIRWGTGLKESLFPWLIT